MQIADEKLIELFVRCPHLLSAASHDVVERSVMQDAVAAATLEFYTSFYNDLDQIQREPLRPEVLQRMRALFGDL